MMKTKKTSRLIDLLEQLLAETEKMNVGKIYIAIMEELGRTTFAPGNFTEMVYKHLIELSIKDYIHSGRSEKCTRVIHDVIAVLSEVETTA